MDQLSLSKGHDKKRKANHSINAMEWSWCHKGYWPRLGEFEGFLDHICIFNPGKAQDLGLRPTPRFVDEDLKTAKGVDQEKKPEDPKGDFSEANKEVNYIYCVLESYESRRKQKPTAWEVMAVSPATPEYLKW
jgi:hypothetical protein